MLLATSTLPYVGRSDLYQQLEWVILEGHSLLLDMLLAKKANPKYIVKRCEGLSAVINSCSIDRSDELVSLQYKV